MTSQQSLGNHCWLHNGNFVFFSAQNLEIITMIFHQWWCLIWWHRAEGETGTSIWHAVIVPQAPGPFGRKLGPSHQWVALHSRTWWLNPQDWTLAVQIQNTKSSNMPSEFWLMPASNIQGPLSLYDKTSYHKFLWSLKATRFVFRIVQSPWNLTGTQQQCCWGTCQISELCDNLNYQFCCFETWWDLMIRHRTL